MDTCKTFMTALVSEDFTASLIWTYDVDDPMFCKLHMYYENLDVLDNVWYIGRELLTQGVGGRTAGQLDIIVMRKDSHMTRLILTSQDGTQTIDFNTHELMRFLAKTYRICGSLEEVDRTMETMIQKLERFVNSDHK